MRKYKFMAKAGKTALSAVIATSLMVPSAAFADTTTEWPDQVSEPMSLTTTDETGTVNGRYITAAASGTYGYVSLVLGLANPVYDNAGKYDATTIKAQGFAGVTGSIANEEPDQYMANYYYNVLTGGVTTADNTSDYPNALAPVGKQRPSAADTGVALGGVPASFYYRPDIVFGAGSGEASGLAEWVTKINDGSIGADNYVAGDETYDPYILDGNADSATGYNTQVYSTQGVTGLLYETAGLVETLQAEDSTLITRYGNDSYQIAEDLENYIKGMQYYTLKQIDNGTITKKTYAVVSSIDATAQTATLAYYPATDVDNDKQTYINKGFSAEYIVNAVGNDLGVELGVINADGTKNESSLSAGSPQGGGGTTSAVVTYTVSLQDLAKADVIFVQAKNAQSGSSVTEASIKEAFETAGITDVPRGFYTSSTVIDSGNMGCDRMQWYNEYLTFMYPEVASTSSVLAYYYKNFYHLKSDYIGDSMTLLASKMTLAEGDSIDTPAEGWTAAIADVQSKIDEGMQYYIANYDSINATYPILRVAWKDSDGSICNRTVVEGLAEQGKLPGVTVTSKAADKGEKATVTAVAQNADSATYRFYYSVDDGTTWTQAAKNTTGVASVTANPTNASRQWKVVATTADGQTAEATFSIKINTPTVTTSTTPATTYGAKATVTVNAAHFGVYGPAKYKYYYSTDGTNWKQAAYHNRQYTETDSLQVTGNATNAKRQWKVIVTFKDGRTAEAPFTVSYGA